MTRNKQCEGFPVFLHNHSLLLGGTLKIIPGAPAQARIYGQEQAMYKSYSAILKRLSVNSRGKCNIETG